MYYLIGNWKMNPGSEKEAVELFKALQGLIPKEAWKKNEIAICPPYPWITSIKDLKGPSGLNLGAQDVSCNKAGAYTGDVSSFMLRDLGVDYVLIGHSERRKYHKEKGETLVKKARLCLKHNLSPVIFIGEEEKDQDRKTALFSQLQAFEKILEHTPPIIVYEPVWAISSSRKSQPASAEDVNKAIKIIEDFLAQNNLPAHPILYGGSTNEKNIQTYLNINGVQGVVPGSASMEAKTFSAMAEIMLNYSR